MKPLRPRMRFVPKTPSKASISSDDDKVQDPVEVFCRIRPRTDLLDTICVSLQSPSTLVLTPPDLLKNRKVLYYTFNHIFTEHANQSEVFEHVALPLLNGFMNGENALLFSYGVTSSGKTYTMSGEPDNPGIVPRCVNALFNTIGKNQTQKCIVKSDRLNGFELQSDSEALIERLQESKKRRNMKRLNLESGSSVFQNDGVKLGINENMLYTVFVTYVEIYNNNTYDLLDENSGTRSLQSKILREDCNRNIYVNGVVEMEVKSAQEALDLYVLGSNKKRMAQTSLNSESSRSHSIFTIRLVISPEESNTSKDRSNLIISQLSLVDLAGSERCSRTHTTGARLKEAGSINNSLMALRTCMEILRENQKTGQQKIVPYRESRLTHLFKNYFEGEGKVKMIICINPSVKDYDETVHVMKFAEMTQEVKVMRPEIKISEKENSGNEKKAERIYDELHSIRTTLRRPRCPLPKLTLCDPDSDDIRTLILYLKRRKENVTAPMTIRKLSDKFRMRLVKVQEDRDYYEKQVKYLLPAERDKVRTLKSKLVDTEVLLDKEIQRSSEKENVIEDLKVMVSEKDFKLRQNLIEKQKHMRKFEQNNEKMTQELDARLRRQREYLTAVVKEKTDKIELVKDILTDKVLTTDLGINIHEKPQEVKESPPQVQEIKESTTSHIARRDIPVANVRYRRSRSAGDVWLQHNPANPVPIGTLLQPVIKCRKSISKLTSMKDVVNPKQSRYVLIDQQADTVGGLETNLYKADIIPTCSGGAQVIFDDVERLKQESPTSSGKKLRRAYPSASEMSAGNGGHSSKKIKK